MKAGLAWLFGISSVLFSGWWSAACAAERFPQECIVFTSGEHGYFAYRIPALVVAADGTLLALAEARKHSLSDPGGQGQQIDLVLRRSGDRGRTWSPMQVIEHAGQFCSSANPSVVLDRSNGRLWLFYIRCQPGRGSATARPGTDDVLNLVRYSDDAGKSWSQPIDITRTARDYTDRQWRITVPGPGGAIQTRSGRMLVPCWKREPYRNFVLLSDDHGKSWQRGEVIPSQAGSDEAQLVQRCDGTLWMDCRQQTGEHRLLLESRDDGRSWKALGNGQKVTPVMCAIERFTCRDKGAVHDRIIWSGPRGPGRKTLCIWTLYNDDLHFKNPRQLWEGYAAYSDLAILDDGTVGVLWEKGIDKPYQYIAFSRVDLSWLEPR